jgi:hypothetical protein
VLSDEIRDLQVVSEPNRPEPRCPGGARPARASPRFGLSDVEIEACLSRARDGDDESAALPTWSDRPELLEGDNSDPQGSHDPRGPSQPDASPN